MKLVGCGLLLVERHRLVVRKVMHMIGHEMLLLLLLLLLRLLMLRRKRSVDIRMLLLLLLLLLMLDVLDDDDWRMVAVGPERLADRLIVMIVAMTTIARRGGCGRASRCVARLAGSFVIVAGVFLIAVAVGILVVDVVVGLVVRSSLADLLIAGHHGRSALVIDLVAVVVVVVIIIGAGVVVRVVAVLGVAGGATVGRHALLLLASIAEPHAHHLLLQLEHVGEMADLLGGGLRVLLKVGLQGALDGLLDARALLALAALRGHLVHGGRRAVGRVGLLEPLGQQRLQLAHVLEAELQRLEATNRRLTEHVAVQGAESEADVGLGEAELDAALLELLGEVLEVVGAHRGRVVLLRVRKVQTSTAAAAATVVASIHRR